MSDSQEGVVLMKGPMAALKDARRTLEGAGVPAQIMQPDGGCEPSS